MSKEVTTCAVTRDDHPAAACIAIGSPGALAPSRPLLPRRELMGELEDSAPVRVLIADDDGVFLESLRAVIEAQPELQIVGTARDGLEAIELTAAVEPDAVAIDPHMPRLDESRRSSGCGATTQTSA